MKVKLPAADAYNYPYRGYSRGSRNYYKELRANKNTWVAFRAKLLQRQDFRCAYCLINLHRRRMNVEHVLALTNGGTNVKENLVAACSQCNKAKRTRKLSKHELVTLRKNLDDLKKRSIADWVERKKVYHQITDEQESHIRSIMNET